MASRDHASEVQNQQAFPRMYESRSARISFEMELKRLHGMTIEDRVLEALGMYERFFWFFPQEK